MLVLKDITKNYYVGNESVSVLKGINLEFSDVGFTSILGQSGSGKTTLLNIIGGLDKYTSGDLIIDNKSTKMFKDSDWDAYRNAKIGFVFQSYNLISHLSILDNVSIALSLSGISSKERIKRAKEALSKVGLSEHLSKKPNQLSGGQMQRVAIARALINNPSIILADEPTGALDSKTSIQVMDILKEISKEHLVIMVTHNKEIAEQYSDRIIEVKDGTIISDTKPINEEISNKTEKMKNKNTKMSFISALSSSFKNLISKKGRTFMTVFAGSIGIIGVALVLSLSNGMNNFISDMEKDTLAGFPLTISQNVQTDLTMPTDISVDSGSYPTDNIFHSYDISGNTVLHKNIITDEYIDYIENMNNDYYSAIHYNYSIGKNLISKLDDGIYKLVDTTISSTDMFSTTSVFSEMPNNKEFILSQYDILAGTYPTNYKEIVLVVDKDNQIDTTLLEAFGIKEKDDYTAEELIGKSFRLIMNDDYYTKYRNVFVPNSDYESLYESEKSIEITICGIMRIKEDASGELLATGINYTTDLTDKLLEENKNSEIVNSQKEDLTVNVLTGARFDEKITYDDVMQYIGGSKIPSSIQIYPKNFENKDEIKEYLENYNNNRENEDKIVYTDLSESMSSSISSMIDTVSIILVAFAGISLVVSTVMIGIITYVSVVERTKEIGIMRAIGARKKDISRIFNAETIIIGFSSGILGIILNSILCIPASSIISNMIGIDFTVSLLPYYAVALIILSMVLTLIAGFFPSKIAARKDPVVALRTE